MAQNQNFSQEAAHTKRMPVQRHYNKGETITPLSFPYILYACESGEGRRVFEKRSYHPNDEETGRKIQAATEEYDELLSLVKNRNEGFSKSERIETENLLGLEGVRAHSHPIPTPPQKK